jgi:D-alanyl-D-alanine carboxypeptidase (penicillin-binding protein 5/6)
MNGLALIILSLYQFLGVHHAPLQAQAVAWLQPPASQHALAQATQPQSAPAKTGSGQLQLSAKAVYVMDLATGTPLVDIGATQQLPIASLTKLTTALVLLENYTDTATITVPQIGPYTPDDALLHLQPGQKFSFHDLLAAALIPSDNDAADTLAISNSSTIQAFTGKMNRLTADWGVTGTHFVSASGLVDTDNYATARALAGIAGLGLANPLFAKLTSTANLTITDQAGQAYSLQTTNKLMGRTTGIKTGFTAAAGQCFVGLATVNGHQVITVVLGSPDRFGETSKLLDYLTANYQWDT